MAGSWKVARSWRIALWLPKDGFAQAVAAGSSNLSWSAGQSGFGVRRAGTSASLARAVANPTAAGPCHRQRLSCMVDRSNRSKRQVIVDTVAEHLEPREQPNYA